MAGTAVNVFAQEIEARRLFSILTNGRVWTTYKVRDLQGKNICKSSC